MPAYRPGVVWVIEYPAAPPDCTNASRIVEQVDIERFRRITNSTLEGLAKRDLNLAAIVGKSAEAKERRLVPEVIEDFFVQAALLVNVYPQASRANPRVYHIGKTPATLYPVAERLEPRFGKLGQDYKQVAFDKSHLTDDPTLEWVMPGHPLFEAVRQDVLERVAADLRRGAIFFDLHRASPIRLDVFSAAIRDGRGNVLHRRLFVVETGWSAPPTQPSPTQPAPVLPASPDHPYSIAIRQPTLLLDLTPAPAGTAVPNDAGLPGRDQVESALVTHALYPFLEEVTAQRCKDTDVIARHLEISLNELIHRQNLRMVELLQSQQAGDPRFSLSHMGVECQFTPWLERAQQVPSEGVLSYNGVVNTRRQVHRESVVFLGRYPKR